MEILQNYEIKKGTQYNRIYLEELSCRWL